MKKAKKVVASLLAVTMIASLVACGPSGNENSSSEYGGGDFIESVDKAKTQLYVGNYNGGLGWGWIERCKEEFEALYANEVFETGKQGVQIMIVNEKDKYSDANLKANMSSMEEDIIVSDGTDLYEMFSNYLDITDIVTEGGENSIASRMNSSLRSYYEMAGGKYYAVPTYQSFMHLVYDVDLFDDYDLWLGADGVSFVSEEQPRYEGLNVKEGADWDDGLPVTYEQFFALLNKMKYECGIIPLTGTGQYKDTYYPRLMNSAVADYAGDAFASYWSATGTVKQLDAAAITDAPVGQFDIPATTTVTLTNENAYKALAQTPASYYAAKLASDLASEGGQYLDIKNINSGSVSHMDAQDNFVLGKHEGAPIAMLIEGGWWFNEVKVTMGDADIDPNEVRYGVMPFPKAEGGEQTKRTFAATGGAMFINKFTKKADLAKLFFKFMNSEKNMVMYEMETGVPRPYSYTLTQEQKDSMSFYKKTMNEVISTVNVQFELPRETRLNSQKKFLGGYINSNLGGNPITNFFEQNLLNKPIAAKDYFKGILEARKENYVFI